MQPWHASAPVSWELRMWLTEPQIPSFPSSNYLHCQEFASWVQLAASGFSAIMDDQQSKNVPQISNVMTILHQKWTLKNIVKFFCFSRFSYSPIVLTKCEQQKQLWISKNNSFFHLRWKSKKYGRVIPQEKLSRILSRKTVSRAQIATQLRIILVSARDWAINGS